ncbi:MAG: hypothetical protein HY360_05170 [Verrucomicrobia bacterium]|nr:hypothetical protein [Verrucomicrobiota bacterium]
MKLFVRYFTLAIVASFLVCAPSAWATDKPAKKEKALKECCVKTKEAVLNGEACAKCVTEPCCRKTAKIAAKSKDAKPCSKCSGKDKEEKKEEKKPME